jgi:cytochrome P450
VLPGTAGPGVLPGTAGPGVLPGRCEFMAAVARPYPALTIAAVLGAPAADAPRLQEWSNLVQRQFDIRALAVRAARRRS